MLIYLKEDNEIYAYNEFITFDEAQQYINDRCKWVDGLVVDIPEHNQSETVRMYFRDNHIQYIIESLEHIDETEPIQQLLTLTKEVDQTTTATSEDNLLNMELICAVDEKLNLIIEHLGLNI